MKKEGKTIVEEVQGTLDEIISQVKRLIKEGNARRVIIKNKKGKTLFQSQLTIGASRADIFYCLCTYNNSHHHSCINGERSYGFG